MNIYDVIYQRKSIRHFKWEPIPQKTLSLIIKYQKEVMAFDHSIPYKIEMVENLQEQQIIKGVLKSKAPYYLVFYSEVKEGYLKNAGYIMQQIVLYMALKRVGSCYLGGTKVLPTVNSEGMKQVMVLAFGLPNEELYRNCEKANRRPMKELCVFKEEVDDYVRKVLNAARFAPSSMNIQPWRFVVYNNRIHLFAKKELPFFQKKSLDFDLGIVLAHIMLALEEFWLEGKIVKNDQMAEKPFKKNEYILTILLNRF